MTIQSVRILRRFSQIMFLVIFFWLILKTTFEVAFNPVDATEILLPYPVSIALEFDPLTALLTWLATGSIYKGLLWSLVILIPTIFIGRFFCGWVCPLGTINHFFSEIKSERRIRKGKGKIESNRYHKYQRIKYYIFFICVGAAFLGSLQGGLFDPLSLLARSIGTFLLPLLHTTSLWFLTFLKELGWPALSDFAQSTYDNIAPLILPYRQMVFHGIITIGVLFFLILILNRWITRFWCRAICPLGAMLGIFSRFAIFGLKKDVKTCDHCNLCLEACQGADNPDVGFRWRQSECHLCLNCQAVCPQNSLSFEFFPDQEDTKENPVGTPQVDVTRRKVATSLLGGLALVPLFRSGDAFEKNSNAFLVRPPGSEIENDFLAKCIRCGQCMRVCPNNALHPTLTEAGLEGLWTPMLIAKIGYCEPTCTLCGQVCPTGAIKELSLKQKVGDKETPPDRIGTAFIDRNRCLPWSMSTPCIVCEEWCPTSPKAIYLKEETVSDSKGNPVAVKQPYVDISLCTGCGACEFACPVADQRAVYITSVGETRNPDNQVLLSRKRRPQPIERSASSGEF